VIFFACFVTACASLEEYYVPVVPNYDHLLGRKFEETFSRPGILGFKPIKKSDDITELQDTRPDGCTTAFGVRESDRVITYWRVTPSPEQCKVLRKSHNP
jgi:hypothetical protein